MGALVTTFAINAPPSPMSFCGLLRWCHTADWIVTNVMPGLDVIIFTDAHDIVRRECPKARILPFDNTLVHVATRWSKRNHGNKHRMQAEPGSSCPANTLLKWEVVNPRHYPENTGVVMYLDSDVDARWCTSVEELERFHFKQKLAEFAVDASCALRATPDHQAPVNTGIMLLKPSYKMYREGLAMLRTRSFNLQTGFNETGPPKLALNTTARAEREVAKARGYWANTWDFVCGDGDQGLFTTMYMARHQQFCVPRYWDKPLRVQHFWGSDKPWCVPPTGHAPGRLCLLRLPTRCLPSARLSRCLAGSMSRHARNTLPSSNPTATATRGPARRIAPWSTASRAATKHSNISAPE